MPGATRPSSAQLVAALGALADAVTVQLPDGQVTYANDAAAGLYGFSAPEAMLQAPYAAFAAGFEFLAEDGSPIRSEDFPRARVLAGEGASATLIRLVPRSGSAEASWQLVKAAPVHDPDGSISAVINIMEDVTALKQAELRQRLLARAGELLSSSLDYQRTLALVAELAVPALADWCTVSLPDRRGYLRARALAAGDPGQTRRVRALVERFPVALDASTPTAEAFRSGEPQLVEDIGDERLVDAARAPEHLALIRGLAMGAMLVVPLTSAGRTVGTLRLVRSPSARSFTTADAELATELGRRAGAAVENAQLYAERARVAESLQASLLPAALPAVPGWATAALYRPAGSGAQVGGDFYDAFALGADWMLVVGDVAGHGAEAAALTALARHTLRTAATVSGSPSDAIEKLNRDLAARTQLSLCTVGCLVLRDGAQGAHADVLCAGHPLPLLVRGDAVTELGVSGPIPGVAPDGDWPLTVVGVEPGDIIVLYTDGVLDTRGADGRFGEQRLCDALRGVSDADDAVRCLGAALLAFQVGEQADDTAVLAVQYVGGACGRGRERCELGPP